MVPSKTDLIRLEVLKSIQVDLLVLTPMSTSWRKEYNEALFLREGKISLVVRSSGHLVPLMTNRDLSLDIISEAGILAMERS